MLNTIIRGHYKIISHLGGGGFGQTYLAEDIDLPTHPTCVVKQLKPLSNETFVLETAKRLFDQEAEILYSLGSHDRIPRLLAHFQEGKEFYLVQEFADGRDLTQEIGNGKRSPEAVAIALLKEILEILVFVHGRGVVHRDIKPANLIRRNSDRKIVLIDFGAVKEIGGMAADSEGNTNLTIAIGSPGYMPIEQMNGKPRFSSDIYAAGMLGIQAITGAEPRLFTEHPDTAELIWRDRLQDNYSPQFLDLLDKMIRYDFRQRYQTAQEVLEAIALLPKVTEHNLPTVIHGSSGNLQNINTTIAVSPQMSAPYAQNEHPSQLHTVVHQPQKHHKSPKLWIWITMGSVLLMLIGSVIANNLKKSTTPEATNNSPSQNSPSPLLTPKPTATPSLIGSDILLKTFGRQNGGIIAAAKAIATKPDVSPTNVKPAIEPVTTQAEEPYITPTNVAPLPAPVRQVAPFVPAPIQQAISKKGGGKKK